MIKIHNRKYLKLLVVLLIFVTSCTKNKNDLEYLKLNTEKCLAAGDEKATPCLEDFFSQYLKTTSAKESLQKLQLIAQSSGNLDTECHVVAHALGRQVLLAQGTIDKAFNECSEVCSRGCYHGAVEKFFWKEGYSKIGSIHDLNIDDLKKKIQSACKSAPSEEVQGECWHGVGHGLVLMLDYNLNQALSLCDVYEDEELSRGCYSGVFMENVLGVGTSKEKKFLKTSDWHFPCNAIEKKYREDCYGYQVIWMEVNGLSPEEVIQECKKGEEYNQICIESLGANLGDFLDNNLKEMAKVCSSLTADLKQSCIKGAVASTSEFGEKSVAEFCSSFKTKQDKINCSKLIEELKEI